MLQKDRLASVKRQGIRSGLGKAKIVVFRIESIKELKASSWDESNQHPKARYVLHISLNELALPSNIFLITSEEEKQKKKSS